MCGICGIISKRGVSPDESRLRSINNLAAHRGPDGEGYHIEGTVALGHRRLAILDLNPRGQQPMVWQNRYWIAFNGEIYNYLELRRELEGLGHIFHTSTDTEVILAAYSEWREGCLEKFNGMWAFAIHDTVECSVFLARDRFGVKPLYMAETADELVFASEIKQLLPALPKVIANQGVLLEWMLLGFENHRAETMFQGVSSLSPGHWLRINLRDMTTTTRRYYQLQDQTEFSSMGIAEATSKFLALLSDAIKLRLRSDVRVGTCLSGGLDSSAISAIASKLYKSESGLAFLGVHAKATESAIDESRFAELVARRADIDLSIVCPSYEDFCATLDEVVYTQEEPFGSPSMFMGWHVFQRARQQNCPVMLNGQGGDEVLLGYERYFAAMAAEQSLWRSIIAGLAQARNSRLSLATIFQHRLYFTSTSLRRRWQARRTLLLPEFVNRVDTSIIDRQAKAFASVRSLQRFEIEYQLPHLLRYEDRNSMRHSIETRLPFLDFRVVEAALSLPADYKIRSGWTKFILRCAMKDVLPDEVIWRRSKLGFEAPTNSWLSEGKDLVRESIAGSAIISTITNRPKLLKSLDSMSLKQRWMLLNLATWERVYQVAWV
jgi:asparagine synthase (glutamine-hydrolysing)